jgi:hypothetical protein
MLCSVTVVDAARVQPRIAREPRAPRVLSLNRVKPCGLLSNLGSAPQS